MTEKRFQHALIFVCGTTIVLYFLGPLLGISIAKGYWILFRNSHICTFSESWAGLQEFQTIKEATARIANKSKLIGSDNSGLQHWDTPFGALWFPKDSALWTVNFALAQLESGAYPDIRIRSGDIVLDCGGYIGDWSKWALKAGAARAIIVEPAAEALECIRRNLAHEIQQGRAVLYPKAVWDSEGVLYLNHAEENPAANAVTNTETNNGEWIKVTTIDQLINELKIDRIDVIKMDIEGAEIRAIHGALKTLNRFRPHLVVATEHTSNWVKNSRDVIQAIREVAPFYRMHCGYCSATSGILTPETLYFSP